MFFCLTCSSIKNISIFFGNLSAVGIINKINKTPIFTVKMRLFPFPALINAAVIQKPEPEILDLKNEIEVLNQKVEALMSPKNDDSDKCRKICDGHGKTHWHQYADTVS